MMIKGIKPYPCVVTVVDDRALNAIHLQSLDCPVSSEQSQKVLTACMLLGRELPLVL